MKCCCSLLIIATLSCGFVGCKTKQQVETETISIGRAAAATTTTHTSLNIEDTLLTLTGTWADIHERNRENVQATLTIRTTEARNTQQEKTTSTSCDTIHSEKQKDSIVVSHNEKTQSEMMLLPIFLFGTLIVFGLIFTDIRKLSRRK